jgi:hypothetical protein
MLKFCPNCGREISEKVKYCPDCGADISTFSVETPKSTIPYENNEEERYNDLNRKPDYSLKNYLLYGGFLLIAIVILLVFFSQSPGLSGGVQSSQPGSNSDKIPANLTDLQFSPPEIPTVSKTPQPVPTETRTVSKTLQINQTESRTDRNIRIAKEIVLSYHNSHIYTLADMYVCVDMASDIWDMLKAQGINAKINVGNVNKDISDIKDADHAWVLAEVAPDTFLALEATGGYSVQKSDNPRYYSGWSYNNPKDLKDAIDKLAHPCPDGYLFGSDKRCHQACGGTTYCTGNSVCFNGQCIGCDPGYIMGDDLTCHQPCGSSTTYCSGDRVCVNNQCKGCDSGYILGEDLQCHQPCGSTSTYCSFEDICINGQCKGCSPGESIGPDLQCHPV